MTSPPGNYDDPSLVINVDPDGLYSQLAVLSGLAETMAGYLGSFVDTLNNLTLSWVGPASTEGQELLTKWRNAMTALFGSGSATGSNSDGAFQRIAECVGMAGINYAEAEDTNQKILLNLAASLNPNSSAAAPPPGRDQNDGPIAENAPPPP